ncbi:C6_DPF domain-containing protein [Meloidogyne graminicola]|uniref:Cysteine-rich DPF motif domain-containing protein 1 n=1 Tax=Meloidogyne graminicola TaxID=189291 RepID=A0A8S9ZDK1_9BILA|nr:C6_DPF domain-containing protein [Meloidogyne graminicola]
MKNPFEPPDFHKGQRDYTIEDFLILGSNCFICNQQICVDEECSLFYKNTYCLNCIWREQNSFPGELIAVSL